MRRQARTQDAYSSGLCPEDRDYLERILKILEGGSSLSATERARFLQILRDYCSFRCQAIVVDDGEHERRTFDY
ncbi:MAG TPA: hypothetical protein VFA07_17630 [Chthonomonadaceae bacterium]|nr:hypothetical protein [Chthonomonadaceae bacterium]